MPRHRCQSDEAGISKVAWAQWSDVNAACCAICSGKPHVIVFGADLLTILCGKGNNAGDGYWVGVLARQLGIAIQLIAVEPKAQLTGER